VQNASVRADGKRHTGPAIKALAWKVVRVYKALYSRRVLEVSASALAGVKTVSTLPGGL